MRTNERNQRLWGTFARTTAARPRQGLTIVEVLVITVVIGIIVALLLPATSTRNRGGRQLKCSSQVRGLIQAMSVWAQSNRDVYPMPSLIDAENTTVRELGPAKDTTRNIMSILVYQNLAPAEMLVSPAEANPTIRVFGDYQSAKPQAALDPSKAQWDPALAADFTIGQESHVSYAHAFPFPATASGTSRRGVWSNTYNPTDAIVGNRGPQITSVQYDARGLPTPAYALGLRSNTFLIHGSRNNWEGNIGFSDNHVDFFAAPSSDSLTYSSASGTRHQDLVHYDEPDAASSLNAFLGIFTTAGAERHEFKSIWD